MRAQNQCWETEGLCESPHDDPPKWAAMLTAYLDESADTRIWVMAGHLGNKTKWTRYCEEWKAAIAPRTSLHLARMRLNNAENKPRRGMKEMLERAALVPKICGLKPFIGMIDTAHYAEAVKGTVAEIPLEGYMMALSAAMLALLRIVPAGERVELIFEAEIDHASRREHYLKFLQTQFRYKGKPIIAKWGSIEKGILTEAADSLGYAYLQKCIDSNSGKALITQPFLKAQRYEFNMLPLGLVDKMLELAQKDIGQPIPQITEEERRRMKKMVKGDPANFHRTPYKT